MAGPYWEVKVESTSHADVEKRHPKTFPLKVRKGLRPGRIKGVKIFFPPGCKGLVGVQVYHRETILVPTDSGEWVHGDGTMWTWEIDWPVYGAGNYIGIKVYNDDDTYEHKPAVALDHVPLEGIPRTDMLLEQILSVLMGIRRVLYEWPKGITAGIKRLIPRKL